MSSRPLPLPAQAGRMPPAATLRPPRRAARAETPEPLPVMRPRLPSAAEILPYLQTIDEARWYSNYGPLVTRLEQQLARRLGMTAGGVVTTANATAGLTAALLARRAPAGSFCLMPSWTFAATAHAARAAGLIPWFHDVARSTWALDPGAVRQTLKHLAGKVGAVIAVSPFGAPLEIAPWRDLQEQTGMPVVVDAAAGFDTAGVSPIPQVVSLHATKILGAGEGGFVATADPELRLRLVACCNFGFLATRSAMLPALNAKMSEYHAAAALASLDAWPATRALHLRIAGWYRQTIARLPGVSLQPGYGDGWATSTTSIILPRGASERISRHLRKRAIDTRAWWGQGCHVQPAFADCPRGPLPVTEELGASVLGVPHFPDMCERDVDRVAEALMNAM
jgi:dTDP-4-amino-4,6-dideoxygalactose transaminase